MLRRQLGVHDDQVGVLSGKPGLRFGVQQLLLVSLLGALDSGLDEKNDVEKRQPQRRIERPTQPHLAGIAIIVGVPHSQQLEHLGCLKGVVLYFIARIIHPKCVLPVSLPVEPVLELLEYLLEELHR